MTTGIPMTLLAGLLNRMAFWLSSRGRAAGRVPDYVPCPLCGEPEVEVWSGEKSARCHNCGNTFDVSREES